MQSRCWQFPNFISCSDLVSEYLTHESNSPSDCSTFTFQRHLKHNISVTQRLKVLEYFFCSCYVSSAALLYRFCSRILHKEKLLTPECYFSEQKEKNNLPNTGFVVFYSELVHSLTFQWQEQVKWLSLMSVRHDSIDLSLRCAPGRAHHDSEIPLEATVRISNLDMGDIPS